MAMYSGADLQPVDGDEQTDLLRKTAQLLYNLLSGGISVTSESSAEATAAAPAYTEGQDAPLSQDLTGNLRVALKAETTKVIGTINLSAAQTLATVTTLGTVTTLTQWTAGTLVIGTGANAIGKLAGNSGVDIGDVDVKNLKGEAGSVVETGTTALTSLDWESIQFLADTVIASYTSSTLSGDSLVGVTIPAGMTIFARFSAITLTSGKIIGYIRNP